MSQVFGTMSTTSKFQSWLVQQFIEEPFSFKERLDRDHGKTRVR